MAYTQLSLTATPGKRYNFYWKAPHEGQFTDLSVLAIPGPVRSFLAKAPVVTVYPGTGGAAVGPRYGKARRDPRDRVEDRLREKVVRDEQEMMELLSMILESGIL